jgi:hypothetical protein
MVASLLLAAAVGKEHNCTIAAAVAAVVATGTTAVGIVGDCPNTVVEGDTTNLMVGYTPYGTLEEHCYTHHYQRIQASYSSFSRWPQQ